MMLKLVDLFTFLSVVLRAGTLVFQSVLLGGVMFVLWVAQASPEASPESIGRIQASSWKLLRISAVGLAVMQLLYRRDHIEVQQLHHRQADRADPQQFPRRGLNSADALLRRLGRSLRHPQHEHDSA